jgi:hypothetical protein
LYANYRVGTMHTFNSSTRLLWGHECWSDSADNILNGRVYATWGPQLQTIHSQKVASTSRSGLYPELSSSFGAGLQAREWEVTNPDNYSR